MYSLAAERIFFRVVSIVNRNVVFIPEGCLGRIRLFLLYKYDAIQFTEILELAAKLSIWDIDEVLIILSAHIGVLLECDIAAGNQGTYIIGYTVVNNQ